MRQIHASVIERESGGFFAGRLPDKVRYVKLSMFARNYAPTQASAVAERLTKATGVRHRPVKLNSKPAKNKYGAEKVTIDGHVFDSKKEARRYQDLKLLEKAGEIRALELQKPFKFPINGENIRYPRSKTGRKGREIVYQADFSYRNGENRLTVEDTKGMMTPDAKIKLALMKHINGIEVKIL